MAGTYRSLLLLVLAVAAARVPYGLLAVDVKGSSVISTKNSVATTAAVIEHPVFFNMEGLLSDTISEDMILQGLNDLVYNNYSDLYFLYSGRVLESQGVSFTHALISRFPSSEALQTYYDFAIPDIVEKMRPWLKNEYCVDFTAEMDESMLELNIDNDFVTYVIFIKVSLNVSDSDVVKAMDAFNALIDVGYAVQLTSGENMYFLELYRTMSHGFVAYFSSEADLAAWKNDTIVAEVIDGIILPLADSYAVASVKPFAGNSGVTNSVD
ncbi:hypothetical protein KP509_23G031000 [Ceratopteris richardii]|uniref:Stress-response A/B barrel domain-containing protein n=1 Tax=Ceratopteris richardii TaxID=49495 RepID=A0A8T2S0T3_CERRI|nr:hypothetical protein KP509_23G031000 [Ceratopteris richardii]